MKRQNRRLRKLMRNKQNGQISSSFLAPQTSSLSCAVSLLPPPPPPPLGLVREPERPRRPCSPQKRFTSCPPAARPTRPSRSPANWWSATLRPAASAPARPLCKCRPLAHPGDDTGHRSLSGEPFTSAPAVDKEPHWESLVLWGSPVRAGQRKRPLGWFPHVKWERQAGGGGGRDQ